MARAWRDHGVKPWRRETFKFSTDPELVAKVQDVVGLYLNPPTNAVVLCVDEKSQIQALNRTPPILPLRPGLPEKATHDYKRNGTTTLFAALEIATGKVTDACYDRHGKAEFVDFLKKVARAYPRRRLHIVLDNYHTHKHAEINRGWQSTPASTCTSPRPRDPGSTWSRSSSGSSPARRSAAAHSTASRNSSPRSAPSSTAGTTAATPSSGPRPPTTSSPRRQRTSDARH